MVYALSRAEVVWTWHAGSRAHALDGGLFCARSGNRRGCGDGSSHCCLGPYWAEKLGKTDLVGYQASARGGVVRVRIQGARVVLGGQAVTVLRGELSETVGQR